jgi:menaquinone-9 beta-reductase
LQSIPDEVILITKKLRAEGDVFDYEIMIVGGGPAGVSTWLHLQKYAPQLSGRSVVIEKAAFPRDKLCAGGVGAWSADVLKLLEVELDIPSLFVSDVEFRFGKEKYLFYQPDCFRVVQRIDFDHALVNAAKEKGLELKEGEMLIDVVRDRNKLIARSNKKIYVVRALIGADGALSLVRRKMIPAHRPQLIPTIQIVSSVDPHYDPEFEEKKMVLDFTPVKEGLQGYVWHFPCFKEGIPSMVHGLGDVRIHPDRPRASMKKIFHQVLESRNIHSEYKDWSSFPIHRFSSENLISVPNVLFVGDAAGIEPAFCGGIHLALSYGEVAAQAIIDAFQSNDFSFSDYGQRVRSHRIGEWIQNCTQMALDMYGGDKNPLLTTRKVFPENPITPELLSQRFWEIIKKISQPNGRTTSRNDKRS